MFVTLSQHHRGGSSEDLKRNNHRPASVDFRASKGVDVGLRADQRSGAVVGTPPRVARPPSARTSLVRAHMESLAACRALWRPISRLQRVGRRSAVDLCVLMEELGFVCAPTPFFGSAVLALPCWKRSARSSRCGAERRADRDDGAAGPEGLWVMNDERSRASCRTPEIARRPPVDGSGWSRARRGRSFTGSRRSTRAGRVPRRVRTDGAASCRDAPSAHSLARGIARATSRGSRPAGRDRRRLFTMALEYAKGRRPVRVPIARSRPSSYKLADVSLDVEAGVERGVTTPAMTLDATTRPVARGALRKAASGEAKHSAKDGIPDPRRDRVTPGSTTSTSSCAARRDKRCSHTTAAPRPVGRLCRSSARARSESAVAVDNDADFDDGVRTDG